MKKLILSLILVACGLGPFLTSAIAWADGTKFQAHDVLLLDDNQLATQARLDLMLKAQRTLKAQYFIFGKDTTALAGLYIFSQAAIRGVDTKLIVDAQFNAIPKEVMAYMHSVGVQTEGVSPVFSDQTKMVDSSHARQRPSALMAKRWFVGAAILEKFIISGISTRRNYVDRDIYVQGPEVISSDRYLKKYSAAGSARQIFTNRRF